MKFDNKKPEPTQMPREIPYSDKSFLHTTSAAVFVPLLQSAVTGGVVFFVALAIMLWVDAMNVFIAPLALGIASFAATWLALQWRWISLTEIERMTGLDLNGDGAVADLPRSARDKPVTVIRIENVSAGHYQSRDVHLTASAEQLAELASGIANGIAFVDREWCGRGKLFSIGEFIRLRREMERFQLIEQVSEKNVRQGYRLTKDGEEWMLRYLSSSVDGGDVENVEEL